MRYIPPFARRVMTKRLRYERLPVGWRAVLAAPPRSSVHLAARRGAYPSRVFRSAPRFSARPSTGRALRVGFIDESPFGADAPVARLFPVF